MPDKEVRKLALRRVPPGDKWEDSDSRSEIFNSLTEGLEYLFQKNEGKIKHFFLSSFEGEVYTVDWESEPEPEPEPPKSYSLYGEDYNG